MKLRLKNFNPALAPILVTLAATANAQGESDSGTRTDHGLEEIVVTAQKRAESASDVGMSITAVTGDTLGELGINSTADLVKVVPGLSVQPPGANISGAPVYTLRGIGFNEKSLAALSAVSFYSDEIPLPYVFMTAGPTLDIERVEVLKGPQGTLYGQNSTGGAINWIANKPTDTFEAGVEASYGSYNRFDANGYVSGPLSDTVRARVAVRGITADGWQKSQSRPNDELGSVESWSARLLLDWEPSDELRFALNFNGWQDKSESPAAQLVGFNPVLYGVEAAPDVPIVSPGVYPFYDALITNALLTPDSSRVAEWDPGVDYKNDNNFQQLALRADWDISDAVTLTSISSWSRFDYETFHDIDASPVLLNAYGADGDIDSFNQELRLAGRAYERLNWIVGANYGDDSISDRSLSLFDGTTLGVFALAAAGISPTTGGVSLAESDRTSKAVFASVDFEVTPTVSLNAGARYTEVDLDFTGCAADSGNGTISMLTTGTLDYTGQCVTALVLTAPGTFGEVNSTLAESNTSWRSGVNWQPLDDVLIYGNVSRGYKSGNIPNLTGTVETQYAAVDQEEVTAYEVGFKTLFPAYDLRINGALYRMDYKDKQLYAFVFNPLIQSVSEQTVNIPESEVSGAELEIVWQAIDGLYFQGGVSYNETEVTRSPTNVFFASTSSVWPPPAGFASQVPGDLKGLSFNLAPELQATLDVTYRWDVGTSLTAYIGATGVYSDETSSTMGASANMDLPSYTTLDLRAGLESADKRWRASVWGRNVTDEFYISGVLRGFDATTRIVAMPGTYGLTLGYSFGN